MGLQIEPISQNLEQYGPWHFGDVRFQQDHRAELEAALFQTATIPDLSDRLLEISKATRADCVSPARPEVTLSVTKGSKPTVLVTPGPAPGSTTPSSATTRTARTLFPPTLDSFLAFAQLTPSNKAVVTFPLATPCPPPRRCLKRRRPDTDVDGPNSASLGCKKRRLLRHLITSRLSQPFSLPATHIPNREAVASGDKRFFKLAAIMSARRMNSTVQSQASQPPQQPSPSTWLRRAAVLNSLRARVCAEAAERSNVTVSDLAAKAAVFQQSNGSTAFVGGRYLATSQGSNHSPTPAPLPRGLPGAPQPTLHPGIGSTGTVPYVPPPCTVSVSTRLRIPSPKLRPLRSPELRVTRPLVPLEDILVEELDSNDDDSVAFPTSEHESRYGCDEDDDEEGGEVGVYADFSVIFGGGGDTDEDEDGLDEKGSVGDCFEDYMDDLDGIPWGARC
ncbi:hypothetical protein N657DRAFT_580253 [Parathielavia appendiculata]|uniref:Uncharacterized protein n=1 Tax=Parathielavia appendiculata TaxID=2587402 RepID=A0AAN6TTA8_9PEZI|nr:hypothetical protein N657DRAFT_580253 [Parathielavia appendiculata]